MSSNTSWPDEEYLFYANLPQGRYLAPLYAQRSQQPFGSRYQAILPPLNELTRSDVSRSQNATFGNRPSASSARRPANARPSASASSHPSRLQLSKSFFTRKEKFFRVGRVLRIAPHERANERTERDAKFVTKDCWGREVMSKPRICILMEVHQGFSNAITINSYSSRGLDKRCANASQHAIAKVTTDTSDFDESQSIHGMLQDPIWIIPETVDGVRQSLQPGSYVDFGKVVLVQHYHEAELFGSVAPESVGTLHHYYTMLRNQHSSQNTVVAPPMATVPFQPLPQLLMSHEACSPTFTPQGVVHHETVIPPLQEWPRDPRSDMDSRTDIYKFISNSVGTEDEFDSSFRQQPPGFFTWGRVFRLCSWTEEPTDGESEITDMVAGYSETDEPVLRKLLWLVVIQEGAISCKCLRIATYEGRGVSELPPELSHRDHSIIYTGSEIPKLTQQEISTIGEDQMGLPVRVRQFNRMEKLFPTARLLWTRVYNVKLDVKAKAFGCVTRRCEHVLENQFRQLNPHSSISPDRPKQRKDIPATIPSPQGLIQGRYQSMSAAEASFSQSDESSDDLVSSSESSEILVDSTEKADNHRMYDPGDEVVLMSGKDGPSSVRNVRTFKIDAARLRRDAEGGLVWEYSLVFPRGGSFHGGRYIDEGRLLPA